MDEWSHGLIPCCCRRGWRMCESLSRQEASSGGRRDALVNLSGLLVRRHDDDTLT